MSSNPWLVSGVLSFVALGCGSPSAPPGDAGDGGQDPDAEVADNADSLDTVDRPADAAEMTDTASEPPAPVMINCGAGLTCDNPPDVCCMRQSVSTWQYGCNTADMCPVGGYYVLACDGVEDCDPMMFCCASQQQSSCVPDSFNCSGVGYLGRMCHTNGDCSSPTSLCCPLSAAAYPPIPICTRPSSTGGCP